MPDLLKKPIRRERLGKNVSRIPISVSAEFLKYIDAFRKHFYSTTKCKISRAYLFREGAVVLIQRLERQIELASKGELHAKKR